MLAHRLQRTQTSKSHVERVENAPAAGDRLHPLPLRAAVSH